MLLGCPPWLSLLVGEQANWRYAVGLPARHSNSASEWLAWRLREILRRHRLHDLTRGRPCWLC